LPCFIPVLAVAFNVARNYLLLARDLKRIDSTTKSPVYALFCVEINQCVECTWRSPRRFRTNAP
jgi:hypothetical protein